MSPAAGPTDPTGSLGQEDRPSSRDEYLADHPWLARGVALAPRAASRSRASLAKRRRRLSERAFFIVQCAVSAGLAWFVAGALLGHAQPVFAPIAALVTLGQSYGQRLRRAGEVVVGVAVGVMVGDLVVHRLGAGYWQLILVILAAMAVATVLDAGVLMTTQAGVQAIFITMITPAPGEALSRWSDAVIGGAVALAAATVTPASPLRRPREHTASIITEVSLVLTRTADALRRRDLGLAIATLERARASESSLDRLRDVADDGLAVIRHSPFRRGHLPAVQAIADLFEPLDRSIRNMRVLIRRAMVAIREGEEVPESYILMVEELADVLAEMASSLTVHRLPETAQVRLLKLAARSRDAEEKASLSAQVIRAQVCSASIDLLRIAGMGYDEAVRAVSEDTPVQPR
ncbi:MAG TPA: FUSC family protein [Dermatophilaceae bacterium]|nr:FUSC family protein [Dermatophilaceae bacterium]